MIVVAGGTGFIGGAIVRELVARGQEVAILSHRRQARAVDINGTEVAVRRADVNDQASLAAALEGADAIVGAVQFKGFPNENRRRGLTFEQIDHQGTVRLVEAARQSRVAQYVYISGVGAAPDARQVWFRAKAGAEQAVRNGGFPALIIRPAWVYGPGDSSLNRYVALVRSPLPVVPVIGNGQQRLQPVFVADVARAVADGLTGKGATEGTFEIGGPQILTMNAIIRSVQAVIGKRKRLVHQPAWLMKALFSPKALMPAIPLPLSPAGLEFALMDATADNGPFLASFPGIRLTPLEEGLQTYLRGGPRSTDTA